MTKLEIPGYATDEKKKKFADQLQELNHLADFKVSARGWAYILEGENIIKKSQFDRVEKLINDCRKRGFLPIDFTGKDDSREASHLDKGKAEGDKPKDHVKRQIEALNRMEDYLEAEGFWNYQDTYLEVWVEKKDIKTLFRPVCQKYKVPIANTRGWYSINMRYRLARRFREMQRKGKDTVLLYFGDFDPKGVQISDRLKKNINELEHGTSFHMTDQNIDRFGLDYDVIQNYGLTWIDNLESSTGKKPDLSKDLYKDWVEKYGQRKVEANAIITEPGVGKELMEKAIKKQLGPDPLKEYEKNRKEQRGKVRDIKENLGIKGITEKLKDELDVH